MKVFLLSSLLLLLGVALASPINNNEDNSAEANDNDQLQERTYGLTNTGRTVLAGILIGVLALVGFGIIGASQLAQDNRVLRRNGGIGPRRSLKQAFKCRIWSDLEDCVRYRQAVLDAIHNNPY